MFSRSRTGNENNSIQFTLWQVKIKDLDESSIHVYKVFDITACINVSFNKGRIFNPVLIKYYPRKFAGTEIMLF